jgi:rRNA maturation RNase YbeY
VSVDSNIHLRRTVKGAASLIPFEKMARSILGARYELSITICADTLARRMNTLYRKKTYSPNVLSFPYSKTEGEIFLNIRKAEREAKAAGIHTRDRIALLFVHGCYHLAGHDHSDKMEALERKTLRAFGFTPN